MTRNADCKILLVDDSDMARRHMIRQLVAVGYANVTRASSGPDALAALEAYGPFDVILSDWNMPDMDGMELLGHVRAHPKFGNTPVIMVTAQGDRKRIEQAMQAGAQAVLPKPFSDQEVLAVLEQARAGFLLPRPTGDKPERVLERAKDGRVRLTLGYTGNLDHAVLPALENLLQTGDETATSFHLDTVRLPSWGALEQAIERAEVDGALLMPPMAFDLAAFGTPLKIVSLAARCGGSCVRNSRWSGLRWDSEREFFMYKVVLIPHKMSLHHMLMHEYLVAQGLRPGVPGTSLINVRFEVLEPATMPNMLAQRENVAACIMTEPWGALAQLGEVGERLFATCERWADHPASVVALRTECLDKVPEAVAELVRLLHRTGARMARDPHWAAQAIGPALFPDGLSGMRNPVLRKVLADPLGLRTDNLFPDTGDLKRLANYMRTQMGIGDPIDMDGLVDTRFAEAVRNE